LENTSLNQARIYAVGDLPPSTEQYILFNGVRFSGAERGKTAHKMIGQYHAAAGQKT
jgi:hypothetical protein